MSQQLEITERLIPRMARMGIFFWMFVVIFIYLLLFGPPEFWSIVDRLGLNHFLYSLRDWLQPFLTAGYLE